MNGKFRVRGASTDLGNSKNSNPKLVLVLSVSEEGPDFGKHLYCHLSLTTDAAPYTIEKLRNLGWTGDDITVFDGLQDASYILRDEAIATCHEEMYEGEPQTVVDYINKIGSGVAVAKDRMNDREKAVLRERMKSIMAASGTRPQDKPQAKKPAATNTRSEFDDD